MTLLITSIFLEDLARDSLAADRAFQQGAEAVELRIDSFDGDPTRIAEYLKAHLARTWIVTCRSAEEGGLFRGDTMERVSRLIAAARGTGAYVDFELRDWRRSSNIQQKVLLAAARPDGSGHRLILSHHDFAAMPSDVRGIVREIQAAGVGAIAKVAYRCDHVNESFAALDLMHEFGDRVIAIAMGEDGIWTRLLAKKLGAFATYCALESNAATALGQAALPEMLDPARYRWREVGPDTKLFGVLGDPVAHSMSPMLFNSWFSQTGIEALYLPFRVRGGEDQLASFLTACAERKWLSIHGFSVTVPQKQAALAWVGGESDALSRRIGAVNTLAFRDGKVTGHNTDCYAAIGSLAAALGCSTVELAGLPVDVLGAGGAARALIEGLRDVGARITVYARSNQALSALLQQYGCATKPWDQRAGRSGEVLINCTPIGLWPDVNATPMPAEALSHCRLVFDLIYNPPETALLRNAMEAECATLNGLDMFIRQAATQFELWTERTPDIHLARRLLQAALSPAPPTRGGATPIASPLPKGGRRGVGCIALIGMRGSGKTTVGRELAKLLRRTHIDTDELIVKGAGRSIADIFAAEGEAGFRKRESDVIREVMQSPPAILSVGGGAILDQRNVKVLRERATLIWLTASPEVLLDRIAADPTTKSNRPALTELSSLDELGKLLDHRSRLYAAAADLIVDTTQRTAEEVAREIAASPLAQKSGLR